MELFYYLILALAVTGGFTLWLALGGGDADNAELTDAERESLGRRVLFGATGKGALAAALLCIVMAAEAGQPSCRDAAYDLVQVGVSLSYHDPFLREGQVRRQLNAYQELEGYEISWTKLRDITREAMYIADRSRGGWYPGLMGPANYERVARMVCRNAGERLADDAIRLTFGDILRAVR